MEIMLTLHSTRYTRTWTK